MTPTTVLLWLAPVVLTLAIAHWQWKPKRLDYKVLRLAPVASPALLQGERVTVTHEGTTLSDPYSLVIRIANNGKVPIRADDFEGWITVNVGKSSTIMEAQVPSKKPTTLTGSIHHTKGLDFFAVEPGLMNRYDWCDVEAIVEGKPRVSVDARVAGVESVRNIDRATTLRSRLLSRMFAVGVVGLLGFTFILATEQALNGAPDFLFAVLGVAAVAFLLGVLIGANERRAKKRPF